MAWRAGGPAGRAIEPRNLFILREADLVMAGGRQHCARRIGKVRVAPARSESLCMWGSFSRGSREIPRPAQLDGCRPRCESPGSNAAMNGRGKSDRPIVPEKQANNVRLLGQAAEPVEGRGLAEGNPDQQTSHRTQCRDRLQRALGRVREKVKGDRKQRMTNLWHHVCDVGRLREAYLASNRSGASGVDGETWQSYGENLEANLHSLSERMGEGSYRARPVRRHYIEKTDGRQTAHRHTDLGRQGRAEGDGRSPEPGV